MAETPTPELPRHELPESSKGKLTEVTPSGASSDWWGSGMTRSFAQIPNHVVGGITVNFGSTADTADGLPASTDFILSDVLASRYRLGKEIGRGGVGVVYGAQDTQLDRVIAIKVLLKEHREKVDIVRRFLAEARITGRLQHPGIVAIHELGCLPDGRPFFVMNLLRGQTLGDILSQRKDTTSDLPVLLSIFFQACQAVAYAHSQGVIHRDLKPANIMVGEFGLVQVMDWGLAKQLSTAEDRESFTPREITNEIGTQLGTVFGTPAYLPPEQARGEIDKVDKRADVFGLGSILCEILTGSPPYTGMDGTDIYHKAMNSDHAEMYTRLTACLAHLDLISLAFWCLSPDPIERPIDASHVCEVMTTYLHSDKRRAEQDLIRFFDLSLDLFCIASIDGYFLRVNHNFPRLLGYTAAELTSQPYVEFVHPEDRVQTGAEVVRLAGGMPCLQFVNRYRHQHGHYIWLEWNALTIHEERVIYAVARNVTSRYEQGN